MKETPEKSIWPAWEFNLIKNYRLLNLKKNFLENQMNQ